MESVPSHAQAAIVEIHGVRAGQLERVSEYEDYVFRFDAAWVEDPDRPTLGQVFIDRMPRSIETSGVPCWFDHLLPQGPARRLMQRWTTLNEVDNDSFDLLVAIGMDLPGAVTLLPAARRSGAVLPISAVRPSSAPGFSLAGVQAKLSVRAGDRGLVIPAWGESGDFIAKFDDPSFPELPRLEFATTQWAKFAGIRAHAVRLASIDEFPERPEGLYGGSGKVLLAERFDRSAEGKIHAEDFGQILDKPSGDPGQYDCSYEALGAAIAVLSRADVDEYLRRLAFMIVCGNGDAHLKNWGVVYPDRRRARLGPAYDLVATVVYLPNDDLALTLGGARKFGMITAHSFAALASRLDVSEKTLLRTIRDEVDRCLDAWSSESDHLPFSALEREAINRHIDSVPLCRGRSGRRGVAAPTPAR